MGLDIEEAIELYHRDADRDQRVHEIAEDSTEYGGKRMFALLIAELIEDTGTDELYIGPPKRAHCTVYGKKEGERQEWQGIPSPVARNMIGWAKAEMRDGKIKVKYSGEERSIGVRLVNRRGVEGMVLSIS